MYDHRVGRDSYHALRGPWPDPVLQHVRVKKLMRPLLEYWEVSTVVQEAVLAHVKWLSGKFLPNLLTAHPSPPPPQQQ